MQAIGARQVRLQACLACARGPRGGELRAIIPGRSGRTAPGTKPSTPDRMASPLWWCVLPRTYVGRSGGSGDMPRMPPNYQRHSGPKRQTPPARARTHPPLSVKKTGVHCALAARGRSLARFKLRVPQLALLLVLHTPSPTFGHYRPLRKQTSWECLPRRAASTRFVAAYRVRAVWGTTFIRQA